MLDTNERISTGDRSPLAQWVQQVIGLQQGRVKVRLQGNILHVLCEAHRPPEAQSAMRSLIGALATTSLDSLLPPDSPAIYQIMLYGQVSGPNYPEWTETIDLHCLDRYYQQFCQPEDQADKVFALHPTATEASESDRACDVINSEETAVQENLAAPSAAEPKLNSAENYPSSALLVPNRSLASQGQPEAIARYLSETLSPLGVSVRVKVKTLRKTTTRSSEAPTSRYRLYVFCESTYSPDPSLLAPTIAQQLRELEFRSFRDAVIACQVVGEATPDWLLKVDLTPNEVMLREWGRWGDVPAISRLLDRALAEQNIKASAILKESTLHLFCTAPTAPDRQKVTEAIAQLLESLAPQGIYAATLYGHISERPTPVWVDWLDLPAKFHPALAVSTLTLAEQGDQKALTFLLNRLLNPDLDRQLITGGVRVQLAHKEDLLHVMTDAPVCPAQAEVGDLVAKFLRQLKIAGIAGVRVYGRRSGQKLPRWSYGIDFAPRQRLVPEAAPEFAASSAYVGDLISETGNWVNPGDRATEESETPAEDSRVVIEFLQQILLRSGLFVPAEENREWGISSNTANKSAQSQSKAQFKYGVSAVIWGALGLLFTLQIDWVTGYFLQAQKNSLNTPMANESTVESIADFSSASLTAIESDGAPRRPEGDRSEVFNASGFTQNQSGLEMQLNCREAESNDCSLIPASPYPSFNNPLLDEQLGRYHQWVLESGAPDVLIVGSSRALRGIDPTALREALAVQGYPDISIYNFGVNGATAQVVDLIIRRIFTAKQLPKLIVWADGTRAFNSGREDTTYKAIAASPGYQKLNAGTLPTPSYEQAEVSKTPPEESTSEPDFSLLQGYQTVDRWLDRTLGSLWAVYPQRDRLKANLSQQLANFLPQTIRPESSTVELDATTEQADLDRNGFLSLSIRFNPITYYQKHPKVTGDYDRDYESFRLEGKQTEALKSLLQETERRSIPLIFVNMPLTQDYLDPIRAEYEREFQQHMLRLAMENSFIFRDLSQLWNGGQNDYFSDPSHLNRYGADAVANHLANDPTIPWPLKKTF